MKVEAVLPLQVELVEALSSDKVEGHVKVCLAGDLLCAEKRGCLLQVCLLLEVHVCI